MKAYCCLCHSLKVLTKSSAPLHTSIPFCQTPRCFHRIFAMGVAYRHRTLTPPGRWSYPILDLMCFDVETSPAEACHVSGLCAILQYVYFTLTEIDECTTGSHLCEQLCDNVAGSYNCRCEFGFSLNGDRRTCTQGERSSLKN